jgi:hypothetical protein
VPELSSYDYAVFRVVPDVERGEFLNAGVILFARTRGFLAARVALDEQRLTALLPTSDLAAVRAHLASLERIAAGAAGSGPIGQLSPSQRFHWLVAPRSTVIQVSPVHSGLCEDPRHELDRLFERLVGPNRSAAQRDAVEGRRSD